VAWEAVCRGPGVVGEAWGVVGRSCQGVCPAGYPHRRTAGGFQGRAGGAGGAGGRGLHSSTILLNLSNSCH